MTIRWDPKRRLLQLSVRDIADTEPRFGGPNIVSMRGRAQMGRVEHERHQGAREAARDDYIRELSLSHELRVDDVDVVIAGRVDGAYEEAGRLIVEEVKTVILPREALDRVSPESYPHYTLQLQIYQLLLSRGQEDGRLQPREIELHLVVVALPSRVTRVIRVGCDSEYLWELVRHRLRLMISRLEARDRLQAARRAAVPSLSFPFDAPRQHQDELMVQLDGALAEGKSVLISAATGIGKSIGTLLPALRRALSRGGQVFVATSKTTQQKIFIETVKLLQERGAKIRALVLTAREKVCQNDVVLCHPEACTYASGYESKADEGSLAKLRRLPLVGPEEVIGEGRLVEACPFELTLDLVTEADVIIGDYNYAFDPGSALRRLFVDGDPSDLVLVVDEAHNLSSRGTEYYSPSLERGLLAEVIDYSNRIGGHLMRRFAAVAESLDEQLAALEEGRSLATVGEAEAEPADEPPAPAPLLLFDDPALVEKELRKQAKARARVKHKRRPVEQLKRKPPDRGEPVFLLPPERVVRPDRSVFAAARETLDELMLRDFVLRARGLRELVTEDPLVRLHRCIMRMASVLEEESEEICCIYRRGERAEDGSLKVLCMDASEPLGRRFAACDAAIGISATLAPLSYYREILGLPEDTLTLSYPSPFPASRRKVLIDPRMTMEYRRRRAELPLVADAVRSLAAARPGNALVCSPSYAYLNQLSEELGSVSGYEVILQRPGMPDADRADVLRRLGESGRGRQPVLLLAVQGGVFTEGVDYPGALCEGVVIVGPALPAVSYERKLMREFLQRRYGRGFDYAFLYPGMNRAIQAAGRVHRSAEDRGVILLLGSRFLSRPYVSLIPSDWYVDDPSELVSHNLDEDLCAFWKAAEGAAT